MLNQYRKNMKGVDLMDQEIQVYKFPHKSIKWWKPIFFHLLEIIINNARIWYIKRTGKKIKPLQFRLDLIDGLLQSWTGHLPRKRSRILLTNPSLNPLLPAININSIHSIILKKGARGYCGYCSNTYHEVRTAYYCPQCDKYLCPPCHNPYHTAYVYK